MNHASIAALREREAALIKCRGHIALRAATNSIQKQISQDLVGTWYTHPLQTVEYATSDALFLVLEALAALIDAAKRTAE